ncbi:hypothetical protein ACFL9U_17115 [Thermodesulfobacteriota bacterium]
MQHQSGPGCGRPTTAKLPGQQIRQVLERNLMFERLVDIARYLIGSIFKNCTMCRAVWHSREKFLSDPIVEVTGYMANFDLLELGIFLFDHKLCGTTLSIRASQFLDLYDGPVFEDRLTGTEECPAYCLNEKELRPCHAKCECAYVREVLNILANWNKDS